jgi:hypothetical protein
MSQSGYQLVNIGKYQRLGSMISSSERLGATGECIRDSPNVQSAIGNDIVWKFICDGLVELRLADPRTDNFISNEQRRECRRWVEYAADGLPKSIVKLGRKIAERGVSRNRVSHADIIETAKDMV